MLRYSVAGILLACLIPLAASAQPSPPAGNAQLPEAAWKKLFMDGVYASTAKDYAKAEDSLVRATREAERFGLDNIRVGSTQNTLGLVYEAQSRFKDAENAFHRALGIFEKSYGEESLDVANVNYNIARAMSEEGHQVDSLAYARKAQQTYEGQLGAPP